MPPLDIKVHASIKRNAFWAISLRNQSSPSGVGSDTKRFAAPLKVTTRRDSVLNVGSIGVTREYSGETGVSERLYN